MSDKKAKPERPLYLDMDFGQAMARYIQTKPEEVEPPPGHERKVARPPKKTSDPAPD